MSGIIIEILIVILTLGIAAFFVVGLVGFIKACKAVKADPSDLNLKNKSKKRVLFIISTAVFGTCVIVFTVFAVLLYMAVAYM